MTLFLLLLTAHFIGDFYLQPAAWVHDRNRAGVRSSALYKHTGVHFLLYVGAFLLAGTNITDTLLWAGGIALSHYLIDWIKSGRESTTAFLLDQFAHIVLLAITAAIFADVSLSAILTYTHGLLVPDNLIYLIGYLIIFHPASILIAKLLSRHTAVLQTIDNNSLGTAGRWIGYVERVLALSFIILEQYTGLGFLVATKTVFRVGDLSKAKDMRLTEYMMLGTLMSFAIALITGWLIVAINK